MQQGMKNVTWALLLAGAALVPCSFAVRAGEASGESGKISLSGAWALYPMVVKWAEEYRKLHPDVKMDVSAGGAGKGVADTLGGMVDLGMVSRDLNETELKKGAWFISVVKDAVVPVVNAGNPEIARLRRSGVKREVLISIWMKDDAKTWGRLLGTQDASQVNVYTRSDACGAAEVWAKYLGGKQEDLEGTGVYGDPGLAEAVRKDVCGIGYNNIGYAFDAKTKLPLSGLAILPLDVDGNGKIDEGENFFSDRDTLMKAVAEGRYPSPPARSLHLVAKGKPSKAEVAAFLKWILTDGQAFVEEAGYVRLKDETLKEQLKRLE